MHQESHKWYSPSLDRDMELLVFGHAGVPVIVFPTSMGKYFEFVDVLILGITPTGRATVEMLDANSDRRRAIRVMERTFGLFPG